MSSSVPGLVFILFMTGSPFAAIGTTAATAEGEYVVFVDAGPDGAYVPAAEAMAKLHEGVVRPFDPAKLEAVLRSLRDAPPRYVVFVLPPQKIDVDLCQAIGHSDEVLLQHKVRTRAITTYIA